MSTSRRRIYSPSGTSVIHPEIRKRCEEQKARSVSSELFLARVSKKKKSFFIEVKNSRTIHVQQYVQKPEYLFDKNTFQPEEDNREIAIVLFLIHGVGGSSEMWAPQIDYFLNEGYEIISLDLLGHGLSSKPSDYNAYEFFELAGDVLHVFDIFSKRRNVLIGHSYGSSFCTYLSKERGDKISKMVLISGGGPTALMPDRCSTFCLPLPMFFFMRPALIKMFRRMAFHVNTSEKIRKKITTFGISAYTLKAIMQGQNWPEAGEQYHSDLMVPVLLIYGKGDKFVSMEDELWMNETIYGSELEIIDNAGHMVMIEAPSIVNHVLHKFLNRDPSTRSGVLPELHENEEQIIDSTSPKHHQFSPTNEDWELKNVDRTNSQKPTPVFNTRRSFNLSPKLYSSDSRRSSLDIYSPERRRRCSWKDELEVPNSERTNRSMSRLSQLSRVSHLSRRSSKMMF